MLTADGLPCMPTALHYTTDDATAQDTLGVVAAACNPQIVTQSIPSSPTISTVIDGRNSYTSTEAVPASPLNRTSEAVAKKDVLPLRVASGENTKASPIAMADMSQRSQYLLTQFDDLPQTQSSNVPEMRRALGAMMLPENFTEGDTQPLSSPSRSVENKVNGFETMSKSSMLSQSVVNRLQGLRKSGIRAHLVKESKAGNVEQGDLILCQCGYNRSEGDMVGQAF